MPRLGFGGVILRMDLIEARARRRAEPDKRRIGRARLRVGEQQGVLTIPPRHLSMVPDDRPEWIVRVVAVTCEQLRRVTLPLLVVVGSPALERDRGRKNHRRTVADNRS